MKTEQLHNTIETLIEHNNWRRGGDERARQLPQKEIGDAIDHAVSVLMEVENLIKQRGRHNTEIAYKAMEMSAGAE